MEKQNVDEARQWWANRDTIHKELIDHRTEMEAKISHPEKRAVFDKKHDWILAELLVQSLDDHGESLIKASEASDRYAKGVAFATWALVVATVVLALATIVQLVNATRPLAG